MPYVNEPIAVIGSGCRFPGGSSSPSKLWDLLKEPRDVQSKIDRFKAENFYNEDGHYHGASNVLSAYLLSEDTRLFDAQFFNIPMSEAEAIDPQQRLLMETVYESLETAGIGVGSLSGSNTAVFVGVMCDDFSQIVYGDSENVPTYAATGSARSILSNRVSYFFNWHGPSMTIDTACSSSLVAVHQAVQVLRSGEAPVAVAAGTNLIFGPTMFVAESNLNMLSKDGRSRMWDAGANGYARGEGVGSLVLKTLSAALRDGDHIEYIIRETGINQDGKTPGITMPSPDAQAALIRDTYARAGLDLHKRSERCQYFEAHGTGTPAGDPQEAGAIYRAFFAGKPADTPAEEGFEVEDILYVGSIKTIIGHTEGTAGIAGLMKASLAIQNRTIPPNMLFTKLNPALEPYYGNLKVPVQVREWPQLPPGVPRRASVNSFGFGGANAHAIIESYEPGSFAPCKVPEPRSTSTPYTFVFSAASEKSLIALLKSYLAFLDQNPGFPLDTLSWSLFRRTSFNFRVSFAADSTRSLFSQIEAALDNVETKNQPLGVRVNPKAPREILGVFTGQGAQWATMGRELILASHFAESVIDQLEQSLSELPDGPDWSLKAEMLAPKEKSRISEGVISQPLCTAVQIMIVELLRQAGVRFSAVVGHSSGEIACAYVSGFLSARDAIRVAFYRGKYTPLAKGGAMIAAGTDMQDAIDLCSLPKLKGKAQLAASNSSASVTISGNADAIDLVEMVMQDESKFCRKLKVDTAYHSFHMRVCSDPYVDSLEKCGIEVHEPAADACPWYSSVTETNEKVTMHMASALKSVYWCDNMLHPVLFSQAVKAAITASGAPGLAIEVGPHPALKGPASMTIEDAAGSSVPYFGTITRGQNDALTMAAALGSIWTVLGASGIDMQGFQRAFVNDATFTISKALPSYPWDHDKIVWNETRISKAHRLRSNAKHELLGIRSTEETEGELRWRNYLKPKEMPWLRGHQIQGQMVFPAAGFAAMALEAARNLAPFETIRLMELQEFSIHRALSFIDENANVETIFALSDIKEQNGLIIARFTCYACLNKDVGEFSSMAGGMVKVTLGEPSPDALPQRSRQPNNWIDTNTTFFYDSLADLGYGYTGMFQAVTQMQRTNGASRGIITVPQDEESVPQDWIIHPATLDVAFQGMFAAVGAPGDGRLWTLHIPTMINSIAVNPGVCAISSGVETPLPFDACLVNAIDEGIAGDVDIFDEDGKHAIVQIQGLNVTPFSKPTAADDRDTFAAIEWAPALPDLSTHWTECTISDDEVTLAKFAERLSLFILRDLCDNISPDEVEKNGTEHHRAILHWAQDVIQTTRAGKHPTCPKAWLADTWEVLKAPAKRLARTNTQIRLCLWVRERLARYVRNELSIEELEGSRPVEELYTSIPYFTTYNERLGNLIGQISFRYRNLRVLEVGTGNGATAHKLLEVLGDNFTSYTCTDLSTDDFESVRARFSESQAELIVCKVLDLEQNPLEQGFTAGSFDLIVASNALHNNAQLHQALKHVRSLLRPGGFLALLEPTSSKSLAIALGGCVHRTWFAGIEEEREFSPILSQKSWDSMLREAGFSGIDTATPEERTFVVPFSVMCSMAVDRQMALIREPLAFAGERTFDTNLLIIGGQTLRTSHLVRSLKKFLRPFFKEISHAETVTEVNEETLADQPTTISLTELDEPIFRPFTEAKFKAVVKLCDSLKTVLWVTAGSRGEDPYMNMMVGVARCLEGEMPQLMTQFLNFDRTDSPTAEILAHHLLRLHFTSNLSSRSNKAGEPLFTVERELTIQKGTLLLPRYLPQASINARLNSGRRLITEDVDPAKTSVALEALSSGYKLVKHSHFGDDLDAVNITVSKALLNAIRVGSAGCLHVVIGKTATGKKAVALSERNESIISVPRPYVYEIEDADVNDTALLLSVATQLLAAYTLDSTNGLTVVHEPSPALANSLLNLATETGHTLIMTSSSTTASYITTIHPSSPDRDLARIIPRDATALVDLSNPQADTIGTRLQKIRPIGCTIKTAAQLYSSKAFTTGSIPTAVFSSAVQRALASQDGATECLCTTPVLSLVSQGASGTALEIIDWEADKSLPVAMTPADEATKFRDNRTYFLVGLAGELGLQMIKWMILRGAKYFALSSRNPKVDSEWLEFVQSQGAVISLYAMDVTNRASVRAAHKKICAEMPPIAGVINGAMILIDSLFANKTHAEFDMTLRPKVDGTVFLDEIFSTDTLDFFIVLSSLASVSGNIGQSAYAAANAFMCSLIAGRRMRGLAGSALNMPGIVGLGYLNRDPRKLERLKRVGYVNINEWELYQFMAEAIVAGRPDSGMHPEITAGLQRSNIEGLENIPHWFKNPRFHTLVKVATSSGSSGDNGEDGSSVRSRLAEAKNEDDVLRILVEALIGTLCARLNMDPSQRGITPDTAIVELGVDSLLAVDMRSWFTKELDLDMPVLKILGGATVQELVEDAARRIDRKLVRSLAEGGEHLPAQTQSAEKPAVDENDAADEVADELSTTPSIQACQPSEETEDEPVVIVPIELPSFDHALEDADVPSQVPPFSEHDSDDGSVSFGDANDIPGTPITSESESETAVDDFDGKGEQGHRLSVGAKEEQHPATAQLFSRLSDHTTEQPEFIKRVRMSYGTSRFWFLMQYLEDPTTFNLLCHIKCTGRISYNDADRCVAELGNRHEIFRTAFFADPDRMNEPTMGILKETPLRLERRTGTSQADVDAEMDELLNYEFKLEQGETIRVKMISLDADTHHVLFGFHHIAMDGFSFNVLVSEINKLYDRQPLDPVSMQFSDFATRQRLQVADGSLEKELQFWKDTFSVKLPSGETRPDFPDPLPLFSVAQSSRKSLDNYEFEESQLVLDARTVRQIKAQCRRHKITTFHFFLGVLRTFLFRQLDVDDLVIGIADANRVDNALDTTMGFMLNLLPLRFKSENGERNKLFKDVVAEARNTVYNALAHSKLPFDALLEKLEIPRSTTHSPLFQVWMDYRPFRPDYMPTMFGGEADGHQTVGRTGYDLTLDVNEMNGTDIRVSFRTQKYLYSATATNMLFESYMRLVKAFAGNFNLAVDSAPLWDSKAIDAGVTMGQGPQLRSEWPETVSQRIAEVATQNPYKEAVKDSSGKTYTYLQLQQRVQGISEQLVTAGVKQGSRVGVFQQPSADWICSLLATWHAGGVYLPMDPKSSLPRLAAITATAKPVAILYHADTEADVVELQSTGAIIDISSLEVQSSITKSQAKATSPATILFTSGSTGTPKGVILRHSAVRNTIEGLINQYGIGAEKVLQQSAFTFDFSLDQMLVGLANGGSVFVVSKEDRADPVAISKIIVQENITYTRATPSEYTSWITYGADTLMNASNWKFAWGGGETMAHSMRQSIASLELPSLNLYNSYGPAESITCTKFPVSFDIEADEDEDLDTPAGFPLPNYSIYITDRNLDLVPQGVKGEILIGGPSVAMGYFNNEKLSGSKFISKPWSRNSATTDIVYRTGDIGYIRADGALMFCGRISGDTQVKIRGMRIDLADIESCIIAAAQGTISKAVVGVRTGDLLVAHVQFAPDTYEEDTQQLAFLRSLRFLLPLPQYMIPAIFVPLTDFPVNGHGKTDRAAIQRLPLPVAQERSGVGRHGESMTDTEKTLASIWKDVAATSNSEVVDSVQISSHTSFFELGGNSLLLVQLQMRVNAVFEVKLALIDLFGSSTLGAMATKIESSR